MTYVAVFVAAALVVGFGIKKWPRRNYRCRIRGCGRSFADPLERAHHVKVRHQF